MAPFSFLSCSCFPIPPITLLCLSVCIFPAGCFFFFFLCSNSADVHCSVAWQRGGVRVCLYSGGTSLTASEFKAFESALLRWRENDYVPLCLGYCSMQCEELNRYRYHLIISLLVLGLIKNYFPSIFKTDILLF